MVTLVSDDDVRTRLTAVDAVRWMGEAVDAQHRGDLVTPPRVHAELDGGRLVFTAGQLRGDWFGYRSYDSLPTNPGSQLIVLHDEGTGDVRAIAVGNELGPRRVGALGAVAANALASSAAGVVAVIGSGTQAWYQLWALAAVRDLREIRVHSRSAARRASFVERLRSVTTAECRESADARSAVEGADIVILATNSSAPVLEADWLDRGCHVTTLGPKQRGSAEFGVDLPAAAALLVTDSLEQINAYDPPNVLVGSDHASRLVSLGSVRAGEVALPPGDRISLFFSVGLAGTEAYLLNRLIRG